MSRAQPRRPARTSGAQVIDSALATKCLRRKPPHLRHRLVMDTPGWTGTWCLLWRGEDTAGAAPPARQISRLLTLDRLPASAVGHALGDPGNKISCLLIESEIGVTAIDESFAPVFDGLDLSVIDASPVMVVGCRDGVPMVIASEFLL